MGAWDTRNPLAVPSLQWPLQTLLPAFLQFKLENFTPETKTQGPHRTAHLCDGGGQRHLWVPPAGQLLAILKNEHLDGGSHPWGAAFHSQTDLGSEHLPAKPLGLSLQCPPRAVSLRGWRCHGRGRMRRHRKEVAWAGHAAPRWEGHTAVA